MAHQLKAHGSTLLTSVLRIKRALGMLGLLLLAAASAQAETASIHLHDGTTVRGEVVGLKGGSYQIQSSSLGTLNIPQSKIKLVEFNAGASASSAAPAPASTAGADAATLANITSRLQNSPALLGDIQSLANDPAIMAIVKDPEIQRLIAAGDYTALMNNAKMRRLMSNSKIRGITSQLK